MKKIVTLLFALVIIGAGCNSANKIEVKVDAEPEFDVKGWYITFDDGQDWYTYKSYLSGDNKFGLGAERSTALNNNNVLVQNTNKAIQLKNLGFFEGVEYNRTDEWIMMDVTAYPELATMPSDLDMVEADGRNLGVRRGNAFDAWYFKTDDKLFEIIPRKAEGNNADIDEIMKTITLQ